MAGNGMAGDGMAGPGRVPVLAGRDIGYVRDGNPILAGIDVEVGAGERVAVVGPSGSGKTTLLAVLAGLLQPTTGELLMDGNPLSGNESATRPGLAIVLQGYGLVSLLTAAENVEIALRCAGVPASEAGTAARDALREVGLDAVANQLTDELSGGQQQRVAVARALALRPRVLLADEPTAQQDPENRALVLDRVLALADRGAAVLVATHDPELVERCDRSVNITVQSHARQP